MHFIFGRSVGQGWNPEWIGGDGMASTLTLQKEILDETFATRQTLRWRASGNDAKVTLCETLLSTPSVVTVRE